VSDNSRALAASVAGAVVGAMAGYLFFSEQGKALRRQIEPALDDLASELNQFRGTVQKAVNVAGEGWKLLNDALGEPRTFQAPRYSAPHQSSPF